MTDIEWEVIIRAGLNKEYYQGVLKIFPLSPINLNESIDLARRGEIVRYAIGYSFPTMVMTFRTLICKARDIKGKKKKSLIIQVSGFDRVIQY